MVISVLSINDVMSREKRDMFFIQFHIWGDKRAQAKSRALQHFRWFDSVKLVFDMVSFPEVLEGNTGFYAVYFDGLEDSRLADYSLKFENIEKRSLKPDEYQMFILPYQKWLQDPNKEANYGSDSNDG